MQHGFPTSVRAEKGGRGDSACNTVLACSLLRLYVHSSDLKTRSRIAGASFSLHEERTSLANSPLNPSGILCSTLTQEPYCSLYHPPICIEYIGTQTSRRMMYWLLLGSSPSHCDEMSPRPLLPRCLHCQARNLNVLRP